MRRGQGDRWKSIILFDGVVVGVMLIAMSEMDDFVQKGFAAVQCALMDVAGRANLHLKPKTLPKSVKRRCMGRFRALAKVVRRLILLMALRLDLEPVRPRVSPDVNLSGEVEDVTASFGAQNVCLRLAPPRVPINGDGFSFDQRPRLVSGPVSAAPVIARWVALHRLLKHPERAAKRLARALQRWRAAGEPKPHILPVESSHKFGAELGLVASLLPQRLQAALDDWPPLAPD